ncbi:hypothetical protein [Haliangium sp.]|uniref:hypothetical protein n=1 Tax=Haliangium sp. TaxID=2663208 RepID=UPI003D127DD4
MKLQLMYAFVLALGLGALSAPRTLAEVSRVQVGNCVANKNLAEEADSFISRCRKASIRREFPGELLTSTLGEIKRGRTNKNRTAWKLLNDSRFAK